MTGTVLKVVARAAQLARHHRSLRYRLGVFTLKSSIFFFKFAAFIKAVPFELCSQNRLQVKLFDKPWQRWLWYLVNLLGYTNAAFQVVSFGWNVHVHGMTDQTAFHVIYLLFAGMSVLYFSNALQKPHELVMIINQIDYLMRISRARNLGEKKWQELPFSILAVNYFGVGLLVLIAPALVIRQILQPNGPMYMSTIFGNQVIAEYYGLHLTLVGLEAALWYWKFAILTVYFCLWNASVLQMLIWMDQLIAYVFAFSKYFMRTEMIYYLDRNENAAAANGFMRPFHRQAETPGGKIQTYRYVQILNVLHNDLNMYFSSAFIAMCTVSTTGLLFVSLTAFNLLSIYMYLPFPALAGFCIVLTTIFYGYLSLWEIKSWEFVQLLKKATNSSYDVSKTHERKVMLREIKSLRPIRNKQAHFGYNSIAVSHGSIEETCNELILLMSL